MRSCVRLLPIDARSRDASGCHRPKTLRPGRKRKLVDAICCEWDVSIRRARHVLEFDTSSYHYKSRRTDQAGLVSRIKEICATRVRYGYRRVHVVLRREGWIINVKKTQGQFNQGHRPSHQALGYEASHAPV